MSDKTNIYYTQARAQIVDMMNRVMASTQRPSDVPNV